jgi:hypothetical protein
MISHYHTTIGLDHTIPITTCHLLTTHSSFVNISVSSLCSILLAADRAKEMTDNNNNNNNKKEEVAEKKDRDRGERLSFRNRAEHLLRRDMKEQAMEICKAQVQAFATCAQENGLWVIYSCRDKLKGVNECLAVHNGEEAWQMYKEAHKEELELRSRGKAL